MATKNSLKTTWDLSSLYTSETDPKIKQEQSKIEEIVDSFVKKWGKRSDYLKNHKVLKKALDDYESLWHTFGTSGNAGYYMFLRSSLDQNDPKLKAAENLLDQFSQIQSNKLQFFTLKLAKIPQREQKKFLTSKELSPYKHFIEKLFAESQYLLSEPEEKILNLKSLPAHANWVRMTSSLMSKEERTILDDSGRKKLMSFEEILKNTTSTKKRIRDAAAKEFNTILTKHIDLVEAEINAILLNKKIDDELRGLTRPDQSRHLSDDVDSETVDQLVLAVTSRFSIAQRYYQLKAKLMKVNKLAYHERNVELGGAEQKWSYPETYKFVHSVFRNLDQEFATILEHFSENGQIDVLPKKGKRGGAFCVHNLLTQPTYILLNHTGKLNDVLTFAHELGHGINNELMRPKQNALSFGTPTSTAEVASTFMEDFVLQELLKKADDKTKLSLLMSKLNDDISTIFRQIALYTFEQELHRVFREKGYLSHQEIGQIFRKHMTAYMGPAVEQSEGSENWWTYIGHFRSFFYVYSYAGGLLISKSLQNSVKRDIMFIEKVKEFLSAGTSDSPRNIFLKLGIDMADKNFWNQGLNEVEALLEETTALAKKLKKI
jgi:oligoendopeptidase F